MPYSHGGAPYRRSILAEKKKKNRAVERKARVAMDAHGDSVVSVCGGV